MKDKQYRLARLKYQLAERKANGARRLNWKLNRAQVEYITEVLRYPVSPHLYRIQTRTLKNYRETQSSLLKQLHQANKQGKKTVVKSLNKKEVEILEDYGYKYWVEKYTIKLS